MSDGNDAVTIWQFQSKLMWSRIQTATVIEAATLGGWYRLWNVGRTVHLWLGMLVLLIGGCLLLIVSLLMRRDGQYMDKCEELAQGRIPSPENPKFGLHGRKIAPCVPLCLSVANFAWIFFNFYVGCC